jgi:hypothetical protein
MPPPTLLISSLTLFPRKQNKIKQAGLEVSGNNTPKPTIFDLKIDTPIHKSSVWYGPTLFRSIKSTPRRVQLTRPPPRNISYSADKASTQPLNTRDLQQQMSDHLHPLNNAIPSPQALRNLRTEPGKTINPEGATTPKESKKIAKFVIIDTKLIFKARLSESPEICDPSDPDNDMGVDHQAFYQRQVPLFLGGGPFC